MYYHTFIRGKHGKNVTNRLNSYKTNTNRTSAVRAVPKTKTVVGMGGEERGGAPKCPKNGNGENAGKAYTSYQMKIFLQKTA